MLLSPLLLITRSGVHDRAGLFMLYSISLVACWPCVSLSAPFVIYQSLSLSLFLPSIQLVPALTPDRRSSLSRRLTV